MEEHNPLPKVTWLEEPTAKAWLAAGTIWLVETGAENSYYRDQFGTRFFCKNYPRDVRTEGLHHD